MSIKQKTTKVVLFFSLFTVLSSFLVFDVRAEVNDEDKISMGYVYHGNVGSYTSSINKANGSLNIVSPNYFNLNPDGSLYLENVQSSFINTMHEKDIKVVPFLSNHWDRDKGIQALLNKDELVRDLVDTVMMLNLDGINIDLENITHTEKELFIEFIKTLRQRLPENKILSVAVAANPNGYTTGWHGAYDYYELQKYCDYLIIMTYDESWYGSLPGPVASIQFVEASIQYALNQNVPSEKIVMGLPTYGRYWNETSSSTGGAGISLVQAHDLIETYNGTIDYDRSVQSPRASFTILDSDPNFTIYGKLLTPGSYTLWFENQASYKEKIKLIQFYNLRGAASWSIGQEHPSFWTYYSLYMDGIYFNDISQHWAFEDIQLMFELGWMLGIDQEQFAPDKVVTRAQAATLLVRAMNLSLDYGSTHFKDIPHTHWAKHYIQTAYKNGLFIGDKNGYFNPEQPLTREQMAAVINRIMDMDSEPNSNFSPFNDILPSDWSYAAIMNVYEHHILTGYPDSTYKPKRPLKRSEMASLSGRLYHKRILP